MCVYEREGRRLLEQEFDYSGVELRVASEKKEVRMNSDEMRRRF